MRASLEPVKGWIEELRMVKSPAEIALIRRSVETNPGLRSGSHARPAPA